MPDRGRNRKAPVSTRRIVLAHAADIATLGDRWFLSLAGGLGMLGGRARKVAEAASTSRPRPDSEIVHSTPGTEGRGQRFDVVSAENADSWSPLTSGPRVRDDARDRIESQGERASVGGAHDAGVVPLLQALARVVTEHSADEYAGLAKDERLWTLIQLLQALGTPGDEACAVDEELQPEAQQTRQG